MLDVLVNKKQKYSKQNRVDSVEIRTLLTEQVNNIKILYRRTDM